MRKLLPLFRGFEWVLLLGLIVFCLWQPHNPYAVSAVDSLQAPNATHWFGTDRLGRDIYSRTGLALRISVLRAGVAELASFAAAFGLSILFTMIVQRYRNAVSLVRLMIRLMPPLLFLFGIAAWARGNAFGPVLGLFALSFCFAWPIFSSEIEQALRHPYVDGTYALGGSPMYVARKAVAPNALPKLLKYARLDFASLIAYEAFLGMGGITQPPQPALGSLIFDSRHAIVSNQLWLFIFPSVALAVTLLVISVINIKPLTIKQ
jgi:peptide/nickel transport system permease protein